MDPLEVGVEAGFIIPGGIILFICLCLEFCVAVCERYSNRRLVSPVGNVPGNPAVSNV